MVVHTQARYDNIGAFAGATDADRLATFNSNTIAQNGNGSPVRVTVTAKKTMKAPVRPHRRSPGYLRCIFRTCRPSELRAQSHAAVPCAGVCVLPAQQLLSKLPTVRLRCTGAPVSADANLRCGQMCRLKERAYCVLPTGSLPLRARTSSCHLSLRALPRPGRR